MGGPSSPVSEGSLGSLGKYCWWNQEIEHSSGCLLSSYLGLQKPIWFYSSSDCICLSIFLPLSISLCHSFLCIWTFLSNLYNFIMRKFHIFSQKRRKLVLTYLVVSYNLSLKFLPNTNGEIWKMVKLS